MERRTMRSNPTVISSEMVDFGAVNQEAAGAVN
jgi:hypothetical protein